MAAADSMKGRVKVHQVREMCDSAGQSRRTLLKINSIHFKVFIEFYYNIGSVLCSGFLVMGHVGS